MADKPSPAQLRFAPSPAKRARVCLGVQGLNLVPVGGTPALLLRSDILTGSGQEKGKLLAGEP